MRFCSFYRSFVLEPDLAGLSLNPVNKTWNLFIPMKKSLQLLSLFAVGLVMAPAGHSAQTNYKLLKEISVGGEGGWDYLAVDQFARRPQPYLPVPI